MIDLRLGDCIEILKTLPDNSVDSIVTDPPYHLTSIVKRFGKEGSAPAQFGTDGAYSRASKGFMGKEWDGGDIAFRTDVWSECLRVLKPGGHLLSFSHSRTYHRIAVAIEDAGFDIRDQIMWIYGQGFPKSHNIGKAIDAKIKTGKSNPKSINQSEMSKTDGNVVSVIQPSNGILGEKREVIKNVGASLETNEAKDWGGWGTALKPAHEPIVMARKPLSEKSVAENVIKWGTGGINIDGCRIEGEVRTTPIHSDDVKDDTTLFGLHKTIQHERVETTEGRFPANIMFDEEAGKLLDEQSGPTSQGHWSKTKTTGFGKFGNGDSTYEGVGEKDKNKDKQGASRFFYCPKVSKKERNAGLEDMEDKILNRVNSGESFGKGSAITDVVKGKGNTHPTVKPIKLMEYLITLVTPKGGVVLEPFMGSGSTGIAAKNLGMSFIGIEKEQEYFDIAKQRIGL